MAESLVVGLIFRGQGAKGSRGKGRPNSVFGIDLGFKTPSRGIQ